MYLAIEDSSKSRVCCSVPQPPHKQHSNIGRFPGFKRARTFIGEKSSSIVQSQSWAYHCGIYSRYAYQRHNLKDSTTKVSHLKSTDVSILLQAGLLLVNSIMILNRRRFLAKYGFDTATPMYGGGNDPAPLKAQIIGLLHAVQYLKVPVILCNIVTIIFELLLGGT
jgi:immediate early response 3-interacting protein 1